MFVRQLSLTLIFLTLSAGALTASAQQLDLWVEKMEVDPLNPAFEAFEYGIPEPTTVTVTIHKDGPDPVPAGAFAGIYHNDMLVHSAALPTSFETHVFEFTLDLAAGENLSSWVDRNDFVFELDEGNNQLCWQLQPSTSCAPYPQSFQITDPSSPSNKMTIECQRFRVQRSGRYPHSILIVPPYEVLEADGNDLAETEISMSTATGSESESSVALTSSIAIETGFDAFGVEAKVGLEIQTEVESALGHSVEQTHGENFYASTQASSGPFDHEHTVVTTQTVYDVMRYRVTSGTLSGQEMEICVPADCDPFENPELTMYRLSDYNALRDPAAMRLRQGVTIGDADSYPKTRTVGRYVDEIYSIGVKTLVESGQHVGTLGADWSESHGTGTSISNSVSVSVNMYAEASFFGNGVKTSFGASAGYSHRMWQGRTSKYHWVVPGVKNYAYEYDIVGYVTRGIVDYRGYRSGLLVVGAYMANSGASHPFDTWLDLAFALRQIIPWLAGHPGVLADLIVQSYRDLAQGPPNPDPIPLLGNLADHWEQWLLQADPAELTELMAALDQYRNELAALPAVDDDVLRSALGSLGNLHHALELALGDNAVSLDLSEPNAGDTVRVFYNSENGELHAPVALELVAMIDGAPMAPQPMDFDEETGCWYADLATSAGNRSVNLSFQDGGSVDDNEGLGWQLDLGALTQDLGSGAGLATSLSANGILGGDGNGNGLGLRWPAGDADQLFAGGLWVGDASGWVLNAPYGSDADGDWNAMRNAVKSEGGAVSVDANSVSASLDDSQSAASRSLSVEATMLRRQSAADQDFVLVGYRLRNRGETPLVDVHVAPFLDLDIGTGAANEGAVDATRDMIYQYDAAGGRYFGVRPLGGAPVANLSFVHNPTYVYPTSGIGDADRSAFLSGALQLDLTGAPDDYSLLASVGPLTIGPGESADVVFAIGGAMDLASLQATMDRAAIWVPASTPTSVDETPTSLLDSTLLPNAPNPFNPATTLRFRLARDSRVSLNVVDVRGRVVRHLLDGTLPAGLHEQNWRGRDDAGASVASGVYLAVLDTGVERFTQKMVLAK